ncbi:MAG TPA: HdeA/HdeB family chaperone [Alphaproteobacteria bacterium]|nr:HdeA/HdeB family chaperone [Alphaproteobacteria bacterium]
MKKLFVAACSLFFMVSGVVQAQNLGLTKVTCAELAKLDEHQAAVIMFWLDGYFSADGQPVIDFDGIARVVDALGTQCDKNPSQTIFQAINNLGK